MIFGSINGESAPSLIIVSALMKSFASLYLFRTSCSGPRKYLILCSLHQISIKSSAELLVVAITISSIFFERFYPSNHMFQLDIPHASKKIFPGNLDDDNRA